MGSQPDLHWFSTGSFGRHEVVPAGPIHFSLPGIRSGVDTRALPGI
jgi:hypothetical protein